MKIREAHLEDANAILEGEREIAQTPGYFCSEPAELLLENIVHSISSGSLYLVAEFDGQIVGHAFLEPHRLQSLKHVADLNMAVYLGWQKKGIGSELLKQIIERAKQSKTLRKIQLNVRASNSQAIQLYKKMGFEEEGRLKSRVKVNDEYIDDIVMGLHLNQKMSGHVRLLEKDDIQALVNRFCFPWSSVQATTEKWTRYFEEYQKKIRTVYVIEKEAELIGYASLLHVSEYPAFKQAGIPEIHDVWIAKESRMKGYGKMLILHLEQSARLENYEKIGLGVGLYADYGAAQRLYTQLGYIPDGQGISCNYQPTIPGEVYPLDDALILWMTKNIR